MPPDFQSIADRINTGTENPDTSRALVVFNSTLQILSGVAVFRASMAWPRDTPLPPVTLTDTDGEVVSSAVREMEMGPDAKGRADRVQLSFALCFAVSDIPANGWRTYLASYTDAPTLALEDFVGTLGLTVVETTRHSGELAGTGSLEPLPLVPRSLSTGYLEGPC